MPAREKAPKAPQQAPLPPLFPDNLYQDFDPYLFVEEPVEPKSFRKLLTSALLWCVMIPLFIMLIVHQAPSPRRRSPRTSWRSAKSLRKTPAPAFAPGCRSPGAPISSSPDARTPPASSSKSIRGASATTSGTASQKSPPSDTCWTTRARFSSRRTPRS